MGGRVYKQRADISLIDFKIKRFLVDETTGSSRRVKLQVSDIRYTRLKIEKFPTVPLGFFRDVHAFLLLFDLTEGLSLESTLSILSDIRKVTSEHTSITLVGNKMDLEDDRCISAEEAIAFADSEGLKYFEISFLT